MRILHILDHSLPLQSGYVFRTLGIVNQQRALGWEPVLLTSGKHYAPGPARERIGGWEFLRTPMPTGLAARLPWLRELKIVSDLDRRLDDVIGRGSTCNSSRPLAGPQRVAGDPRRPPASGAGRLRSALSLGGRGGEPRHSWRGRSALSSDATDRDPRAPARRCGDDDLRGPAGTRSTARGIPAEKITVIPNAVDRNAFTGRGSRPRARRRGSASPGKRCSAFSAHFIPMRVCICCCARCLSNAAPRRTSPSSSSAAARRRRSLRAWPEISASATASSSPDG